MVVNRRLLAVLCGFGGMPLVGGQHTRRLPISSVVGSAKPRGSVLPNRPENINDLWTKLYYSVLGTR